MSFGMVIGHNLGSMNALSALNQNSTSLQSALQKLSTGKRINSAADDAAGLAISQKMQSQINGLDQANRNAQDGISLIQTAEGALNETQSILQRMRTLSVQASNDTNTTDDRNAMQQEIGQLTQEIDRIANTTQFNTKNLLNGGAGIQATVTDSSGAALAVGKQVTVVGGGSGVVAGGDLALTGVKSAQAATLTFTASANGKDIETGSGTSNSFSINGVTITLGANASGSDIADAINKVSGQTGVTASYTQSTAGSKGALTLTSTSVGSASDIKLTGATVTAAGAATDTFTDTASGAVDITDVGGTQLNSSNIAPTDTVNTNGTDATATIDTTNTTGNDPSTVTASGNYLTIHGGDYDGLQLKVDGTTGQTGEAVDVKIDANNTLNLQIGANQGQTMNVSIGSMTSQALGVSNIDVTSVTNAENSISTLDSAIKQVSNERANLGAYQNRLEHTINNLSTASDNLTTAESGITDTNMAQTMAEFTKDNVLQQAAVSMLAQANQQPQMVLKLLG